MMCCFEICANSHISPSPPDRSGISTALAQPSVQWQINQERNFMDYSIDSRRHMTASECKRNFLNNWWLFRRNMFPSQSNITRNGCGKMRPCPYIIEEKKCSGLNSSQATSSISFKRTTIYLTFIIRSFGSKLIVSQTTTLPFARYVAVLRCTNHVISVNVYAQSRIH